MNMNNYAIIDATTTVINVVIWDGQPPWTPPQDCIAVEIPEGGNAGIGWTYVDGEFIAPTTSEVERPAPGPNYRGFYDGLLISTAIIIICSSSSDSDCGSASHFSACV